jgi:hypothetical protein
MSARLLLTLAAAPGTFRFDIQADPSIHASRGTGLGTPYSGTVAADSTGVAGVTPSASTASYILNLRSG